jgi:hypothetical protein
LFILEEKIFFRALKCVFISVTATDFVPFLFEYPKYETITEFYSFTHFCAVTQIEMQADDLIVRRWLKNVDFSFVLPWRRRRARNEASFCRIVSTRFECLLPRLASPRFEKS